ncbi:MAG: biotin/lipoyl-containing protein, partial [Gemmatimonadaceae bacterium]
MIFPLRTPRVNNNDDTVKLSAVYAKPGAFVREGEMVAEVETDKATFTVEANKAGYFLKCMHTVGETIAVGSVLAWLGEDANDAAPEDSSASTGAKSAAEPTLKAALLLKEYGLNAADVPSTSERLSVAEVQAYIAQHALQPGAKSTATAPAAAAPTSNAVSIVAPHTDVKSRSEDLSVVERGMMRTVSWHARVAVPGYVEIVSNAKAWEEYGAV